MAFSKHARAIGSGHHQRFVAFGKGGVITKQGRRATGVQEDHPLTLLKLACAAIVDQTGSPFAGIDRIKQDAVVAAERAKQDQSVASALVRIETKLDTALDEAKETKERLTRVERRGSR